MSWYRELEQKISESLNEDENKISGFKLPTIDSSFQSLNRAIKNTIEKELKDIDIRECMEFYFKVYGLDPNNKELIDAFLLGYGIGTKQLPD